MPEGAVAVAGQSTGRVRVEATEIKAEGGPFFPRLTIPIRLDLVPQGQAQFFTVHTIECGLYVDGYGSRIADAVTTMIPYAVRSSTSLTWNLEFPLDRFRVQGLEAKRHGDLKLRLDIWMISGTISRIQGAQGMIEVVTGLERSASQVYLEVPQSHWVGKVLPGLGTNKYFLVEVPVQNQHFAPAWALIEKAEQAFGRWDTKAVFAHCREAGVALTNFVERHHNGDSFLKDERWSRAVKEFNHFASLDLHLEEKKSSGKHSPDLVKIEKMDAECLLIFTKALAKYAEELVG
jgi:hypothetical protein